MGLLSSCFYPPPVKKVTPIPDGSLSDNIQIEVETIDGDGSVSQVVKEIVDMGGKIYSFYEKEISLEELFSKVIDTEDKRTGR